MSKNGDAIIVWQQPDDPSGDYVQIFKSEYRNHAWTHPASLTDNISPDGQGAEKPKVAMDGSGNALITWIQFDGTNTQVFKSEYRGGAWTHPTSLTDNISPDGGGAYDDAVAIADNGDAVIAWRQHDGANHRIFKSERRSGVWTHPSSLTDNISPSGQDAFVPQVAMDGDGNTIVVWYQSDGANLQVFKSEYRNNAWVHPASLSDHISPGGQDADDAVVAMSNNGDAAIAWRQSDGTYLQVFKSEYRNDIWVHPSSLTEHISPDGQEAHSPQIAMDSGGNTIIVWAQSDGAQEQVFKSEYRSSAWTHPSGLTDNISPNETDARDPRLAMDDNGNALIAWSQYEGTILHAFKSEYRNGAWTHPADVTDNFSPDGQHAYYPQPAMDGNGNALIAWYEYDGTNDRVFKSEYR